MTQPSADPMHSNNQAILPDLLLRLHRGLIVSCQALAGEPLHGEIHMAAMAVAAAEGGAVGIRANSPADIAAIRRAVALPIIGLYKLDFPNYEVRVTPTVESAIQVAQAGADVIAIDGTRRPHPDGLSLGQRIQQIHAQASCLVMADIATYREGMEARDAHADLVATTLSGYTADSPVQEAPDFDLLHRLVESLDLPVIAEGRINTPELAAQALRMGAFAVVVGTAITRPRWITEQFVRRMGSQ